MKTEMLMPQMGESITEAKISKWRKSVGDVVAKDEIILDISTDKVDSEIPSPADGVITEILFQEGDTVPVKTKIAVIDASAKAGASAPQAPVVEKKAEKQPENKQAEISIESNDRGLSPLVRSIAEKHGLSSGELANIQGSGQGGRLNKQDVLNYIEKKASETTVKPAVIEKPQPVKPAAPVLTWDESETKIVPMDGMRQAIAEHMVRSKHTSPHVYSIQEVDVSNISKFRQKNKDAFQKNEGFGLSFTPFFLEAAVKALQQFPYVNSSVDGNKIILKKHVNLGCAVALGNSGLIVPVIKRAEEKNFVGIARSLNELALKARNKKLVPNEVSGGTFTVTNPGVFGTIIGTPIINQPQAAILCLGAIKKRPVVIDDMIAIREICYLTLSYDHRIIDGSLGGQFLAFMREYLENWDTEQKL